MANNADFNKKYTNTINKNCNNIIVLDIETDGKCHIVQIAYSIYDKNMNKIKSKNMLINNGKYIIDYYKKFNYSTINREGLQPINALKILQEDMNECNYIIGHNICSDIGCIQKFAIKNNFDFDIVAKITGDFQIIDTMKVSKQLLDLKDKNGRLKNPKLSELYSFLHNNNIDENKQHSADYDIETTLECVVSLIKLDVIMNIY
jgi:hypothetical protein